MLDLDFYMSECRFILVDASFSSICLVCMSDSFPMLEKFSAITSAKVFYVICSDSFFIDTYESYGVHLCIIL